MCRSTASSSAPSKSQRKDSSMPAASSSLTIKKERKERKPVRVPAFDGASFDVHGSCLKHGSVQLAEQVKQDGRLLWRELKTNCPKCVSEHHRDRRVTSLGGAGKVKRGRVVHGISNPLRDTSKTGRRMDTNFDTPFDGKGRCHHHPNIQMATKRVRGGWKILTKACPRCIEANWDEESLASGHNDAVSVGSRSTKRSVATRTKAITPSGKFDKNGCCTKHAAVQVAKKKLMGGWKEYRQCPKCLDPDFDDVGDDASQGSRRSKKSVTSFRSHGTAKSGKSRKSTRSVGGNGSRKGGGKTDRYGALPFDGEGYCHAHPGVKLAKKKAMGGWKVIHDICPDCAHEADDPSTPGSSRASSRRSSRGTGRLLDDSGSDASGSRASSGRSKKIRVKGMRHRDEHGREGKYTGEVDEDHIPHGQGKMKYRDGGVFVGVWNGGSQVHGKTTKGRAKSPRAGGGSKRDDVGSSALVASKGSALVASGGSGRKAAGSGRKAVVVASGGGGRKAVRKWKWMDYYGDPGEYTGEVDGSNMPDGKGSMKYDHGLVQKGLWMKGRFVEGSDLDKRGGSAPAAGRREGGLEAGRREGGRRDSRDSRRGEGGRKKSKGKTAEGGTTGGRATGREKHSPSRTHTARGMDP